MTGPTTEETTATPWSRERHEILVVDVLRDLERIFDLGYPLADRTLRDAMGHRLLAMLDKPSPCWGEAGAITEIAKRSSPALRFLYRPHLMPDMSDRLRLAHQLQYDLLPREVPGASPFRISAMLESYCHLSGDVLGWRMEGDEFFLWIADVCGHGVRAGLAAAVFYFLVGDLPSGLSPAAATERLGGRFLEARNPSDPRALFATAFLARFDRDGRGVYASAGHPPVLLRRRAGTVERFGATGLPLGMFPSARCTDEPIAIAPEDLLMLFTDGIIEADDAAGNELGMDWLEEALQAADGDIDGVMDAIDREISARTDRSAIEDDLTYVVATPREI